MTANPLTFQPDEDAMRFLLMLGGEGPQPTYRAKYNYVIRGLLEAGMIEHVGTSGVVQLTALGHRFLAIT